MIDPPKSDTLFIDIIIETNMVSPRKQEVKRKKGFLLPVPSVSLVIKLAGTIVNIWRRSEAGSRSRPVDP